MKEVSIHVGQRIRLYRKTKNLTIETFAGMIHKSKATVPKYENGDISIDIETLFTIAQALGVPVNQLIDYEEIGRKRARRAKSSSTTSAKANIICTFTMADAAALRAMLLRSRTAERTAVYSARICMLRLRTYPIIISVSSFITARCARVTPSSISILKTRIIRWSECLCTPSIPLIMAAEWKDFAAAYPRSRFCLPASNF